MIKLLKKEIKLVLNPLFLIFSALASLILIPNYPVWVGMLYSVIAIQVVFSMAAEKKDLEFTAMLPVSRDDIVFARHFDVVVIELTQILASVPFALLAVFVVSPGGNPVGMDANMAFFGMVFVCYAVLNLIFLPWHFKTGYKSVPQMLVGLFVYFAMAFAFELVINLIPALKNVLDTQDPSSFWIRFGVLAGGIVIYIAGLLLSYRVSAKNFRKVNL